MRWKYWPIYALALVGLVHVVVDRETREPPNYSRIEDGLWLGGSVDEPPPGTGAVLNVCEIGDRYRAESHRWVAIPDAAPVPTLDWLRQQVEFIESERAKGRGVYVHCFAGVSRSATVTAAYLMSREKWSRDQALTFLRSRRPEVRPNPAFMEWLTEWERTIKE